MFTGIIERLGEIVSIEEDQQNLHLRIRSELSKELKIDQSIAHNGVCLTVVEQTGDEHVVTAILETRERTTIDDWKAGQRVNLERCLKVGDRLDGHFVQGHVDQMGECLEVKESGGSWYYTFAYKSGIESMLVDKGSICIDGTSLTVVEPNESHFKVAIIPYTHENTSFHQYQKGTRVNLEFDVLGKYIGKLYKKYPTIDLDKKLKGML